ncbi:MAG: hypothetical protein ACTSQ8_18800 [Candidatus Helarchaeota archaeon]
MSETLKCPNCESIWFVKEIEFVMDKNWIPSSNFQEPPHLRTRIVYRCTKCGHIWLLSSLYGKELGKRELTPDELRGKGI